MCTRRRVAADDLPSRNMRCSSIFDALGRVKQPLHLQIHLRLLPEVDFLDAAERRHGFNAAHLGSFKFLTNISILLDEPHAMFTDTDVEASTQGMLAPCIEAVRRSS